MVHVGVFPCSGAALYLNNAVAASAYVLVIEEESAREQLKIEGAPE